MSHVARLASGKFQVRRISPEGQWVFFGGCFAFRIPLDELHVAREFWLSRRRAHPLDIVVLDRFDGKKNV